MGWLRNNFRALKYIADAIWALNDQAKRLADAWDGVTTKSVIDGADPEVQKALGIQEAKTRKRYRGTYTDEQSISSKVGRKVKRGELKEAAAAVGVACIQDETNHHVYIMNTCLDLVVDYLKNEAKK